MEPPHLPDRCLPVPHPSNLFDFAWNVRAAERAGHIHRHGHYCLWLVDALAMLCDGWLAPGTNAEPPALRKQRRTRLDIAPMTTRGIDMEQLKALAAVGASAMGLATLASREEQQAVLLYPALVGAGDAAGIERATGIRTSSARLLALASRICLQAAADASLNAMGVVALRESLHHDAGNAPPRELEVSARPRPASAGAAGPLPFDAGQAHGASAAGTIALPAQPAPRAEESGDEGAADEGAADDCGGEEGGGEEGGGEEGDGEEGDGEEGDGEEGDGDDVVEEEEGEEEEIPPYTRPPSAAYKAWYARQGFDKQGKVSERKRRSRVKLGVVGRQKAHRYQQATRREAKRKRMEEEEEEVGAVRRAQMAGAAVLRAFSRGGS